MASPWRPLGSPCVGMRTKARSLSLFFSVLAVLRAVCVTLVFMFLVRLWWLMRVVVIVVVPRVCALVCAGALRLVSSRLVFASIFYVRQEIPHHVVTIGANVIRFIRLLTCVTCAACKGRLQTFILERVLRADFVTIMRFHSATCELELDHKSFHAQLCDATRTILPYGAKLCEFL